MMTIKNSLLFLGVLAMLCCVNELFAQVSPTYTYRSVDNPFYWKNRVPVPGYWQQDVHYQIKASLDDQADIVSGSEELTYYNNSPDPLPYVYFHLYNNAHVKGSYYEQLTRANGVAVKVGKRYYDKGQGIEISSIRVGSAELKTELDNTILKVYLPQALSSGDSIKISIDFKTYYDQGTIRNRMKQFPVFGNKHYDIVHWYPRIAVYDAKFGWDTQQHLGHEYYGDFGTYDVEMSLPMQYIAEATGVLMNRAEVLPDELRKKLDIANFANTPWEAPPTEVIKPDGTFKVWKFHAVNVHDFALTTDPTYRIGEVSWNGIQCIALVQESHARGWQRAAEYVAKVVKVYSEDFGMYAYPKMIAADAKDGMEYPMLTLDGGYDPSFRSLLAHEIGHNWFFGMVGNNETYRACLDEGFTQFLTSWAYEKIDGPYTLTFPARSSYVQRYTEAQKTRDDNVYKRYMSVAIKGEETLPINTHSDGFNGAIRHGGGYSLVYSKTATMLYNLQYVLGDSLFQSAMKHYFDQWKIAHPYLEDFRQSMISYTKVDLNWFFDQWLETTKTIDYKVCSAHQTKEKDKYIITFERKGWMQMPIDFDVIDNNDSVHHFHIPNTWFVKDTKATVLPRWIGWDNKLKPVYTATVTVPGGLAAVHIDPTHRLGDVYMPDNSLKRNIHWQFDSRIYNDPEWTNYEAYFRPDIWYNGYDGLKLGLNLNGNFYNYKHIVDATVWLNTGVGQSYLTQDMYKGGYDNIAFRITYKTATDQFIRKSSFGWRAIQLDGLSSYSIFFDKKDNSGKNRVFISLKSMIRSSVNDMNYLIMRNEWGLKKWNNTATIGLEHNYTYKAGSGNIVLNLRSSTLGSDYDFAYLQMVTVNRNRLGKLNLNTRVFAQYGTGLNWAKESNLFLAGANPEELVENKYTRSQGIINPDWAKFGSSTNYLQTGGGLNLRGYAGYLAPEKMADGSLRYTYRGTSGASVSAELEFDQLLKLNWKWWQQRFQLNTYLFGDAGVINYSLSEEGLSLGSLRADAGVGTSFTIKKWGPLQKIRPLVLRFDMPLFLNRPPAVDGDFFKFRWVVGINRAF